MFTAVACTCRLQADTVKGLTAVACLPFSIYIHIDTTSVHAWLSFTPVSKFHAPAINVTEIAICLHVKINLITFSFIILCFRENL